MSDEFTPDWLEAHRVDLAALRRDEVVGIGHVLTEVDGLVARLRDPARAAAFGLVPPRGILFWGQPGLGRTRRQCAPRSAPGPRGAGRHDACRGVQASVSRRKEFAESYTARHSRLVASVAWAAATRREEARVPAQAAMRSDRLPPRSTSPCAPP